MRLTSLLIAGIAVAAGARGAPPEVPPRFPAAVELVRIDVTAVDREGRPVTDLRASDFEVTEKGRPRDIVTFEPVLVTSSRTTEAPGPPRDSGPRTLAPAEGHCYLIFFDDVHVSPPVSEWVRRNLAPFLEREVKDGDWVTIVAPEKRIWWTARTPWEHRQLPELARRLSGQLVRDPFGGAEWSHSDWQAMQAVEYGFRTGAQAASRSGQEPPRPVGSSSGRGEGGPADEVTYAVAMRRIRHTLGVLREAIDSMAGFRGRRSLFLVSEGFIRSPRLRELQQSVIAAARRANVVVHFVAAQGLVAEGSIGERWLETMGAGSAEIAMETGGRSSLSNDVVSLVRETLEQSSAYYLLGIRPPDDKPGEHRVRVRVRRPGVRVDGRSRYFLAAAGAGAAVPPDIEALRAVSDSTDLPLRVSTAVPPPVTAGPAAVRLSVEVLPVPGEARERRLGLRVLARPFGGGAGVEDAAELTVPATSEPLSVVRELPLRPGLWQARVVVSDVETGALSSVVHTFEVPAPPADPASR